ncbi:MAG: DNA repair protein RecO [Aerococcus sp.]|nr:DNA repair protein RecO [Aerococcus sp.]
MADNYYQSFTGIVLSTRPYKEKDMLIKIFTKEYGKRMFFARNAHAKRNDIQLAAFPFVRGDFIGHINPDGLSFINEIKTTYFPKRAQTDITVNAYATYLCNLTDASMEDRVKDPTLFQLLWEALAQLEVSDYPEIMANIFELKLLPKFGIPLQLHSCVICQEETGPLDFSEAYHGMLCFRHFQLDPRRLHWSAQVAAMIQRLSIAQYNQIHSIRLRPKTIQGIRRAIDELYEEYVGLHLKSKSFIDQLEQFNNPLIEPSPHAPMGKSDGAS